MTSNRPAEIKEVEYFKVTGLPYLEDYFALKKFEPGYGICQHCNKDVLLLKSYKEQASCYHCYLQLSVSDRPPVILN